MQKPYLRFLSRTETVLGETYFTKAHIVDGKGKCLCGAAVEGEVHDGAPIEFIGQLAYRSIYGVPCPRCWHSAALRFRPEATYGYTIESVTGETYARSFKTLRKALAEAKKDCVQVIVKTGPGDSRTEIAVVEGKAVFPDPEQ